MHTKKPRDGYESSRLFHIIEAALEYFISIMVGGVYLARITKGLGFSDSLTGILSSFFSLGCVFQLGALVVFRQKRRVKRAVILLQLIEEALFAAVYLFPILPLGQTAKTVLFLICFCGGYVLMNLLGAPKSNWMISLVSDETRGIFTAKKEMVSLLGGMLFTYVMGSLIDRIEAGENPDLAFVVGAISMFVLLAMHMATLLMIREKPREIGRSRRIGENVAGLFRNKPLVRVILLIALWNIAYYSAYPYYAAYQINELGFSMTFVSVLSIAYSIIRTLFSPFMGKLADKKSFSFMSFVCFCISTLSFLINCFTVPANGKILYPIFYCLHAVSMAGVNSAQANMVYDLVKGEERQNALAITLAISGIIGFVTTCLMSPVVSMIQKNGNQLLGIPLYAQQFVSAFAFLVMVGLLIYTKKCVLKQKKDRAAAL